MGTTPDEITTTTIRIERSKLVALKRRALDESRSLASLIREIIDGYLQDPLPSRSTEQIARDQHGCISRWMGTSMGKGFAGRDHDEILYGRSR